MNQDPEKEISCERCGDTGIIEVHGGSDSDEWGVVDEKRCPDCNDD